MDHFLFCLLFLSIFGSLHGCGKLSIYNTEVLRAFDGQAAKLYSKLPLTVEREIPLTERCPSETRSGQTLKAKITFSGGVVQRDGPCTMVNNKTCEAACKVSFTDIKVDIKFVDSGKQASAVTIVLNYNAVLRAAIYSERDTWGPTGEFLDPWIQNAPNDGPMIIVTPKGQATLCLDYFRQQFNQLISNQKNLTRILNATVEAMGVQALNKGCLKAIPAAVRTAECMDAHSAGAYSACIKKGFGKGKALTWPQIFDLKCRRKFDLNRLEECNKQYLSVKTKEGHQTWYKVWGCVGSAANVLG